MCQSDRILYQDRYLSYKNFCATFMSQASREAVFPIMFQPSISLTHVEAQKAPMISALSRTPVPAEPTPQGASSSSARASSEDCQWVSH